MKHKRKKLAKVFVSEVTAVDLTIEEVLKKILQESVMSKIIMQATYVERQL